MGEFMNMQQFRTVAVAAAMFGSVLVGTSAQAQLVNGSLTGPIANNGTPTGWVTLSGSPDTMNALNNVGVSGLLDFGATPSASPDGGTWVGIGSDVSFVERFGQTLSGLVVGTTYVLSWSAGNFGYSPLGYVGANAIRASLDGLAIGTGATLALGSQWVSEAVTFTATSASQILSFQLDTSAHSYMSIDGIALAAVVPEPQSLALMLAGLACAGLAVRRGKRL